LKEMKMSRIVTSLLILSAIIAPSTQMVRASPSPLQLYITGNGQVVSQLNGYFGTFGIQTLSSSSFNPNAAATAESILVDCDSYNLIRSTMNDFARAGKLVIVVGNDARNAFEEFLGVDETSATRSNIVYDASSPVQMGSAKDGVRTNIIDVPMIARGIKIHPGGVVGRMACYGSIDDTQSLSETLYSWIASPDTDPLVSYRASTASTRSSCCCGETCGTSCGLSPSSVQAALSSVTPQDLIGISSNWHWITYDEKSTVSNPQGKQNVRIDYYKLQNSPSSSYQWFLCLIKHQEVSGSHEYGSSWMNEEMETVTCGNYVGQTIFDWQPKAQPGSHTVSYTIGGTFSGDKGSVAASASVSYEVSDVALQDHSDIGTQTAHWFHEVTGYCPFCPGIATQSWTVEPAAIFQLNLAYPPMVYHHSYRAQFRDCSWFHTNVQDFNLDWYTSITPNVAPYMPSQPYGPTSGYKYETYMYSTSTTDDDANSVRYIFDWGDGTTTTTGWYDSGTTAYASHYWSSTGTFYVKVRAQDWDGAYSDWSTSLTMNINNRPPNQPSQPSGYTSGYVYATYSYSTSATDPDSDNVRYEFDWNDGTYTDTGYYPSGVSGSASHSWSATGTFNVKVRAQDSPGAYGPWSNALAVTISDRAPNTPSTPSGPTSGYTYSTYTYSTTATDPDGGTIRYVFDWGDGQTTTTGYYNSGSPASASHYWSATGTFYVKVRAQDPQGTYSSWSSSLTVVITSGGGGGGGCPYVFAWNGHNYVKDNNLLPASETGNGTDTKDYYKLEQPLIPVLQRPQSSLYSLQIREFENETDYIDQVKLMVIDHPQGTNIAVTPEGEILTYTNPASPTSCIDNHGINRLNEVGTMNGNVNDPSTYFQGYKGDWLVLDFGKVTGPYAKLILRDDQKCCDVCINVQTLDSSGNWQTVEVLHPRDFWGIEAVNMAAYAQGKSDFKVRLLWTATHRLDYVGLDTSAPAQTKVSSVSPTLAVHSTLGDVRAKLLSDDEQCVKLVNGQQITLTFLVPNTPQTLNRDFIFYTNGYYYTTTN